MFIFEIFINIYSNIDIMRHFTKNILNKKIALISTKRNLFNISEKGFARNFKSSK